MSTFGRMTSWLPLIIYSGFIFYLSSSPPPELGDAEFPGSDKLLHVGAYLVWGLLCAWGLARTCPRISGSWFVLIVTVAGGLYGLTDEFHQSFVPDRTADLLDVLADLIGSLTGASLAYGWVRTRRDTAEPSVPTDDASAVG